MIALLREQWDLLLEKRWLVPVLLVIGFGLAEIDVVGFGHRPVPWMRCLDAP